MPTATVIDTRLFEPGTTGWTADDLDDPKVEAAWTGGGYEIVQGVLTMMAPAYFFGGRALLELAWLLKSYLKANGLSDELATEVDLVIDQDRVARPDAIWMTSRDLARQAEAAQAGRRDPLRTRILVPPTLVIESVSPGHELHDVRTKHRWYAEFGVPNYWILDAFGRSLQCLALKSGKFHLDVVGRNDDEIRPALFPSLVIPLKALWPR